MSFSEPSNPVLQDNPLSDAGKSLIRALLDPDPLKRLGSSGGASAVKVHPFFAGENRRCGAVACISLSRGQCIYITLPRFARV